MKKSHKLLDQNWKTFTFLKPRVLNPETQLLSEQKSQQFILSLTRIRTGDFCCNFMQHFFRTKSALAFVLEEFSVGAMGLCYERNRENWRKSGCTDFVFLPEKQH